ncbi:MAG: glycosyltransferase family 1 protein, partial [Gammaproteobacteria bacterium]|nr:glycosyltransferase family 1 protein [Gammaproteobacteria bacterium]
MKRLKVLMSAYSCEPGKGSEPGVGWNMALSMCKYHDVWVITRSTNKILIEKYLKSNPVQNLKFVYFDLPIFLIGWQKNQRGIRTHYYFWQLFAYFTARKLHEKVRFDLGHHVSMVMYWMPSFFIFMKIPFIWGTVGGGESMPENFYKYFPLRTKIYESARSIAQLR